MKKEIGEKVQFSVKVLLRKKEKDNFTPKP